MEVMDRRAGALAVGLEIPVRLGLDLRVVHPTARMAAISEGACDADGPQCIEAISVLNDLTLQRRHRRCHSRPLER